MERAASTTPGSISHSAAWIWREKKGTVATTSGKTAPVTPMDVPTRLRVVLMNGMERKTLMTLSSVWNTGGHSRMPPFWVTTSSTPKRMPKPALMSEEKSTICTVCTKHLDSSFFVLTTLGIRSSATAAQSMPVCTACII